MVVTGASAGIGEAIAREYGRAGAALTLVARRKGNLDRIAAETGAETFVVEADLGDVEHATDGLAEAERRLGPVDVLVNNAGVQIIANAVDCDTKRCEDMLRLNVMTPMRLTRAVLPGMIARGRGAIVDVASMAALTPMPGMFCHLEGGARHGPEACGELRHTGVHVLTVCPGPVETDMARRGYEIYEPTMAARYSPVGNASELARMIRRGVERRRARIIYPRAYAVALWFPRISRWVTARLSPPLRAPAEK
ncbi:MAG: SDR family NAD(P)-dependent oxidoreductase [Polyangiaceae bacterium]